MQVDLPLFGTVVLCALLVSAAYTAALAVLAGRSRPALLKSARWGTYATCALVALAVFTLAYAFQTHDFRIRYVSRYSDRSMPWYYLVTSLWGGQDGSLLWWTFLLSLYTTACMRWVSGKYVELQPWVIATLMSIFMFFAVLMLFAANPFAVNAGGAPPDGEGLNPLLQNYWMIIHPPTLYSGFVGWSIPFAFVVAALITGRLGEEWIYAIRRWVLVAWLALSCGNLLGMLWSYEELAWGGYWAWDPVENAAILPWFAGTAYLHSVMIQERRGMMKVYNVFLLCLTFFMTIFGTFLTRSGLIASVHSFARSDIGQYFVWYLCLLIPAVLGLIFYRLPKLRSENRLDAFLSREVAFIMNNWILLGMLFFVLIATTFPLISEAIRGETVTVGPAFYNRWMIPFGITLLVLAGIGPLIAWRKASGSHLLRAFRVPVIVSVIVAALHIAFGKQIGFPAIVGSATIYSTLTGYVLAVVAGIMPVLSTSACAFVTAAILQEFVRGTAMRMRSAKEPMFIALLNLTWRARRRYGGYLVHLAIVVMFLGFTGAAYDVEKEFALHPGESVELQNYTLRYDNTRMEADANKRMMFSDISVFENGHRLGRLSPAKFIYRTLPDMPTSEVAIRSTLANDLYVVMNSVNPETRVATFKAFVRPFVAWIWIGGILLILATLLAAAPSWNEIFADAPAQSRLRGAVASAAAILLAAGLALMVPSHARADGESSTLHAGVVHIRNAREGQLFERLLCMCGDCQRLPLSTCACSTAVDARATLRERLDAGESIESIVESYRAQYGTRAVAIPSDKGLDRAMWAVPIGGIVLAAIAIVVLGRRWARRGAAADKAATPAAKPEASEYDKKLDDELKDVDGM